MAKKKYEMGVAKVNFSSPMQKVNALVANMDKMSSDGWVYRGLLDNVSEVILFYQREIEPPVVAPTPVVVAPVIVKKKLIKRKKPKPSVVPQTVISVPKPSGSLL